LPYEQCAAVFERIGEQSIPASSIWRQTQVHGERLRVYMQHQQEQVSVERVVLPDAKDDHLQRKAVALDGGMVHIRGEGWREMKVGAVVGDGAAWVWNVAEDVCPDARQIVDWFHAAQHLAQAATELYPHEGHAKQRQRWLTVYKNHLYMGRIHAIITALTQRNRPDLAHYFQTHQRRMQYLEFREERFPTGSGVIESGVKQFKQRLTGAGMRWNADNAQRMLLIRAAVLGNDFPTLWTRAS